MNTHNNIDISIVIPIMNEEENIIALAEELNSAFKAKAWEWECVWIDDSRAE